MAGSEKQFIEDNACLEQQHHCRQRQMLSLKNLAMRKNGIDVLCFQEFRR